MLTPPPSGLGIGTAAGALIAHGIPTTALEIDPAVYDFATRHFGFPPNHTAVIRDAVSFVEDARGTPAQRGRYDYVIHDVFTGGAEPVELFTVEFLEGVRELMKEGGVIAIVSDLISSLSSLVSYYSKTRDPS